MIPGWEVRLSDPRRERRRRWLQLLLVLAVPAAFALGWYWPQVQPQQTPEDTHALLTRVAEQEQELELLRQRLAVVGSSDKVTQQAMEQNRRTIKLLEEQIFKQQQDLASIKACWHLPVVVKAFAFAPLSCKPRTRRSDSATNC